MSLIGFSFQEPGFLRLQGCEKCQFVSSGKMGKLFYNPRICV